ncbi:uncharacterized protein LOC144145626 isoform X1 [Haemaphysalis longicornis]
MVAASAKSCFRVESGSLCGLANSGHQPNAGHYDVPPAKPVELGADTVRLLAAARAIRGFAGVVDNVPCLVLVVQGWRNSGAGAPPLRPLPCVCSCLTVAALTRSTGCAMKRCSFRPRQLEEVEQHSPPMSQQVNCQLHNSEAARNGPGAALPREGACSEARHLIAGPGKVS